MNSSNLSVDALSAILYYLDGFEIASLWFCGSTTLNHRLSKGGVKHFEVSRWGHHNINWPCLVKEFDHLESFKLVVDNYKAQYPDFIPQFEQISSKLKSIEISFTNSIFYLNQAHASYPGLFPNLKNFKITKIIDIHQDAMQVVSKWQNLEQIRIVDFAIPFEPFNLSQLDTTNLTVLSTHSFINVDVNALPLHLTDLEFRAQTTCPKDVFGILPPHLTRLKIFADGDGSEYARWNWSALPRGLLDLEMTCAEFSPVHASQLPPNLQRLTVLAMDVSEDEAYQIIKELPKSLTFLADFIPSPLSARMAKILPLDLSQSFDRYVAWEAVPYLPPKFSGIQLEQNGLVPDVDSFSPSVKSVVTEFLDERLALKLPQNLECLSIEDGELTSGTVKSLPQQLKSLDSLALMNSEAFKYLPPKLLCLDTLSYNAYGVPILHLESAEILPRTLEFLTLGCLDIASASWFNYLPQPLHVFKFQIMSLPEDSFKNLAKYEKLKELQTSVRLLPTCGVSHFISALPEQLEIFKWTQLPGKDGDDDPPACDVTDSTLSHLPKNLVTLCIPESNITKDCAPHLPLYLTSLDINFEEPSWLVPFKRARFEAACAARGTPLRDDE